MHVPQNIIGCGPLNFYVKTSRMCRYLEDTFWADSVARSSTRRQTVCVHLRMCSRFRNAHKQVGYALESGRNSDFRQGTTSVVR
jgi:hypothetical protein